MDFDFFENIARRKLGQPPEWKACIWERIGPDACKIEGGLTTPILRGPRKGRPKWAKRYTFVACIVTDEEFRKEKAQYETETGNCADCQGHGKVICSVSVAEGAKYRDCSKCKGTGKRVTVG